MREVHGYLILFPITRRVPANLRPSNSSCGGPEPAHTHFASSLCLDSRVRLVFPSPDSESSCSGLLYNPPTYGYPTVSIGDHSEACVFLLPPQCIAPGLGFRIGSAGACDKITGINTFKGQRALSLGDWMGRRREIGERQRQSENEQAPGLWRRCRSPRAAGLREGDPSPEGSEEDRTPQLLRPPWAQPRAFCGLCCPLEVFTGDTGSPTQLPWGWGHPNPATCLPGPSRSVVHLHLARPPPQQSQVRLFLPGLFFLILEVKYARYKKMQIEHKCVMLKVPPNPTPPPQRDLGDAGLCHGQQTRVSRASACPPLPQLLSQGSVCSPSTLLGILPSHLVGGRGLFGLLPDSASTCSCLITCFVWQ